jgi:Tol biopolymer transport system component
LVAVTGSDAKGLEGLYGVDPSTGQVQLLIGKEQNETVFHGQWSSDGRFFYNRHTDARQGLYRLDIHTGAKQTIYIPPAPWRVAGTALSPNDGQLAFEEDNYAAGLSRLRLLALDGKSEARDLWTTPPGEQFPCCRPFTWSPDSRRLLIVKSADSVGSLWELDVDTDTVHRLALSVRGLMNPSLSTDGSRLLYQAGEERSEIWAVENVR